MEDANKKAALADIHDFMRYHQWLADDPAVEQQRPLVRNLQRRASRQSVDLVIEGTNWVSPEVKELSPEQLAVLNLGSN